MSVSATRHLKPVSHTKRETESLKFERSIAVVIGINDYGNGIPPLSTAVNDASHLATLLHEQHGYEVFLLAEDVRRERIAALFTQELALSKDDRLLVYFAGHGIALDGEDGPEGFLIPQDADPKESATFLKMAELHGWLDALPCRHLLTILDCCFAGAFRWAATRALQPLPEKIYRERFARFVRDRAWQVITSAAYDQKALDFLTGNSLGERGTTGKHSPFAESLFAALAGKGDLVPAGGDGLITATELYLYLRDYVEVAAAQQAKHRQTPGLWPLKKHDKGEFIFLTPGRVLSLESAPPLTSENNPYRGLASYNYETKDARLFFGRERLIEQLVAQVTEQPLTVVVGASGTGKSSLVKAGLLPRLALPDQAETSGTPWRVLAPLRPGDRPLDALGALLSKANGLGETAANVDEERGILQSIGNWLATHSPQKLVLVIDQFEELITLCGEEERTRFLKLLATLRAQHGDQLRLILTLRSDFEPQFANVSLFAKRKEENASRFVVPPLTQAELREVIENPAAANTLFFEESALVDDLINEVIQTPGALPLLSFTLSELYLKYLKRQAEAQEQGRLIERSLTRADYEDLGGVIGSLNQRASEEHDKLPDDKHRATLQRVMLRMVAIEGGEVARRRVPLNELRYPNEAENQRTHLVIERFTKARLLVSDQADLDQDGHEDSYVEPAHDALVRVWDKLLAWKRSADEYLPLQRRLTDAANQWVREGEAKKKTGLLWNNNPRLGQLQQVLLGEAEATEANNWFVNTRQSLWPNTTPTNEPTWLNQNETDFVQESVRRRASVLRRIVGITAAVIMALTVLSIFANDQRITANRNAETAVAESNARATEVVIRSTAEAIAVTKEAQRASAESTAIAERDEAQRQARLSRSEGLAVFAQSRRATQQYSDDTTLILARDAAATTLYKDGYVTGNASTALFNVLADRPYWLKSLPSQRHTDNINDLAWSPNSDLLATASTDRTIKIWDPIANEVRITLAGHTDSINSIAWSPNARWIIAIANDGSAIVWDVKNGHQQLRLQAQTNNARSVAWSHYGNFIAMGEGNDITIWNTSSGQKTSTLTGHKDTINTLAWSPTDTYLAASGWSDTVRVWDIANSRVVTELPKGEEHFNGIAWGTNDDLLATSAYSASLKIWNAQNGKELLTLQIPPDTKIEDMAWAPGDTKIIAAQSNGAVKLWNIQNGEVILQLGKEGHRVTNIAISPDGQNAATVWDNQVVVIWDATTGDEIGSLGRGHKEQILFGAWSPDGKKIVTTSQDGTVIVWDFDLGIELLSLETNGYPIYSAVWSPNNQFIATSGESTQVQVWDTFSGEQIATFVNDCQAPLIEVSSRSCYSLKPAWSPDSKLLATTAYRGDVKIWDVATGAVHSVITESLGLLRSAAWSPDGKRIAVASGHGVIISNAQSGETVATLEGHKDVTLSVSWSSDSTKVVSTSWDKTAKIWDSQTWKNIVTLTGHREPVWSAAWNPTNNRIATVSADKTLKIWDTQAGRLVESVQVDGEGIAFLNVEVELSGDVDLKNIWSVSWHPSGETILTTSAKRHADIWVVEPKSPLLPIMNHGSQINTVEWSPDNLSLLTAGEDGVAKIWSTLSGHHKLSLEGHLQRLRAAVWNPPGDQIATLSDDQTARTWDVKTGQQIDTILFDRSPNLLGGNLLIRKLTLDWSPRTEQILIGGEWNARVWDIRSGTEVMILEHKPKEEDIFRGARDEIFAAKYSPDGNRIVTSGADDTARIWHITSNREPIMLKGHVGNIEAATWSYDGLRIVTASSDGTAKTWDVNSGKELLTFRGHRNTVNHAAWSHDNSRIATASSDETVKIWDANSGKELFTLPSHQKSVLYVAWNNDDSKLASAGSDGTARIWWSTSEPWLTEITNRVQSNTLILSKDERWQYGYE